MERNTVSEIQIGLLKGFISYVADVEFEGIVDLVVHLNRDHLLGK